MRLNIGSGDFPADGWENIDTWQGHNPDTVASLLHLPHKANSADAVYLGHVIEHIPLADVEAGLKEAKRVMKPGSHLMVVAPDCDLVNPDADPQLWKDMVCGGHRWPGDEHQWQCTQAALLEQVRKVFPNARTVDVEDISTDWPVVSRIWWQCAVTATKPIPATRVTKPGGRETTRRPRGETR